jgi:hypothetical protein
MKWERLNLVKLYTVTKSQSQISQGYLYQVRLEADVF